MRVTSLRVVNLFVCRWILSHCVLFVDVRKSTLKVKRRGCNVEVRGRRGLDRRLPRFSGLLTHLINLFYYTGTLTIHNLLV